MRTGGDSMGGCAKREPIQHSADRAQWGAVVSNPDVPTPVSWTFNQKMSDAEVRDHFEGLTIASQPGAIYGPDVAEPHPRSLNDGSYP